MQGRLGVNARFRPCGDAALSIELGAEIRRDLSLRVLAVKAAIEAAALPGMGEIVPSYRALLIHFDPLQTDHESIIRDVEPYLDQPDLLGVEGRRWRIPCCYEPEFATDIEAVAKTTGLSVDRIVALHSATIHCIYMLGFAPGQPHMGDLPPELYLPRRAEPVLRIERGSVVIATGLTVVYPIANATGWHVVGRTPVSLFDAGHNPPTLFTPGDRVEFVPISAAQFAEIEAQVAAGAYLPECESGASGCALPGAAE